MPQLQLYRRAAASFLGSPTSGNAPIDWLSDTIKCMLVTSSYTPNLDTDDYKDDVVANEITGTGYTAGGATLGSASVTYTAANSWATAAATSTAYAVGDIVRPSAGNGHLYMCIVAGTSGGSAPTWPTVSRQTVTDGTVTWAEIGGGIVQFDAADASWSSATLTARYAVVYDSTPATDATRPLIGLLDFGSNVSSTASTFTIPWDSRGLFAIPTA